MNEWFFKLVNLKQNTWYNKGEVFAVNNIYSDSRYNIIVVITIARAHITYKGNNEFFEYQVVFLHVLLNDKYSNIQLNLDTW